MIFPTRKGWTKDALDRLGVTLNGERRWCFPIDPEPDRYADDGRTPKLIAADGVPRELWPDPADVEGDELLVLEGRPDVVSATVLGFPAVSMPSATKMTDDEAERIAAGRHRVYVVADCDPPNKPGRKAARQWAETLAKFGPTFLVELDAERNDYFDVGDVLIEGGPEYGREFLRRRMDEAEHVHAADPVDAPAAGLTDGQRERLQRIAKHRRVVLTPANAIRSERVRWLAHGRIPLRGLTAVAGEKGLGKSIYTNAQLVAAITRGALEGELQGRPADVLILTAEDDWRAVVKPRLMAYGADLSRVHRVEVHDKDGASLLTLPDDVRALEDAIVRLRDDGRMVALVVVDPVGAFVSEATNTHAEAPVRRVLAPLAMLADRLDLAVVAVMHLNKDEAKRLISRVSGAAAFVNAARSVLAVVRDPDDPDGEQGTQRLILHVGSNWGRYAPTLATHVESRLVGTEDGERADVGYLVIDGESATTVDDVQHGRDDDADDAEEAVAEALADGPRRSLDVKKAVAEGLGCSRKTVERAAMRMRDRGDLTAEKAGFPAKSTWTLVQQGQNLSVQAVPTDGFGSTASNTDPSTAHKGQKGQGFGVGPTAADESPPLFDGQPAAPVIPDDWKPYGTPAEADDDEPWWDR